MENKPKGLNMADSIYGIFYVQYSLVYDSLV